MSLIEYCKYCNVHYNWSLATLFICNIG